jgi:hypothetical protein
VPRNSMPIIDVEALRTLESLVHSIEVSLNGLDNRIRRELEVVEVSMALAKRARELLDDLVRSDDRPR